MRDVSIARNYAEALLALARKAKDTAGWGALVSALGDAVAEDKTLRRFLETNRDRLREIGPVKLVDDAQDYLLYHTVDETWTTRLTYQDPADSEWYDEEQLVETISELVELYNPADIYAAFGEAAREAAGLDAEPTAEGDLMEVAGISAVETLTGGLGEDPYAAAHGPNESLHLGEFARVCLAEALLLRNVATQGR